MINVRYSSDKPKECKYCYFWAGKKKGCERGKENCYYILSEKAEADSERTCAGCPYGRDHPCIGFCLKKIMQKGNDHAGVQS